MTAIVKDAKELGITWEDRFLFYRNLIQNFEDMDCDTLNEALGYDDAYDEAYFNLYPREEE